MRTVFAVIDSGMSAGIKGTDDRRGANYRTGAEGE
jgi:hypothetical protein